MYVYRTLWLFRVTIVALAIEERILCVLLSYMSLSTIQNIECCTAVIQWKIYVASHNKMYVGLHVKCPMPHLNERMFVCIFSIFMRVAVKHFTRLEGINFEAVIINYYECVSVFLSQLSGMQIAHFLRSIILSWLALPYFSTLSHKWHDFREKSYWT